MSSPDTIARDDAPRADLAPALVAVVFALVSIGIVMVWSTSAFESDRRSGDPTFFLRRQVLWAMLAAIGLVLAWSTDYRKLLRLRGALMWVVGIALVAVLFAARDVKGAHRWFDLGGFHVQPSEVAKLATILFLAGHAADRARLETLRGATEALALLGLVTGLIAIEPDLGTAALVGMAGGLLLLVAGIRLKHLALLAAPASLFILAYGAYAVHSGRFEHVRTRLSVFLDPDSDPMGKGYQIRQALIALGSGGPLGLGLGDSKQKLFFLPDDHTDFILAILGEELGLVGTLAILTLFLAFVLCGMRIALAAADREGFLLAFGLTTVIGLQAAMNMAVVTASMPTKGISLPFVSFGGSSLLAAMAAIGLLLNVSAGREAEEAP